MGFSPMLHYLQWFRFIYFELLAKSISQSRTVKNFKQTKL